MVKIVSNLKDFFSSTFNVVLISILILAGIFAFLHSTPPEMDAVNEETLTVHFFYTPTCPYCNQQKPIYEAIKLERTDIQFLEHDASTQQGSAFFQQLALQANMDTSRLGVPTIFVGDKPLVGFQSEENILSAIDFCIDECAGDEYTSTSQQPAASRFSEFDLPFIGRVDLTKWSIPVLAIILGLVDGFNPCALWVLIFLVTLLLGEKNKKKIWLVLGSFVFASAVSYFLFMTAWLNLFLLMGYMKLVTIIIGMFALGMGVLTVRDWIKNKGEVVCNVGDAQSKKKTMDKIRGIVAKPITLGVIISVIGLAFAVNAVEFVCSAAIPAVFTQLLALSSLSSFAQYMHILLYVFFYMLDHIIIFGMVGFALSSGFAQKYAKYCKIIGGILMIAIGLLLLFAPHLLR